MSGRHKRTPKPPPAPLVEPDWTAAEPDQQHRLEQHVLQHARPNDPTRAAYAVEMREAVDRGEGELALEVWCSSPYRGKPCRSLLAAVWSIRAGHYLRWWVRTSAVRREAALLLAMEQREQGLPGAAALTAGLADDEALEHDACLQMPSRPDGGFELACPRHGSLPVADHLLEREATSTRRKLDIDVEAHRERYTR
ncbi:MAG TPA: hypothetical protein VFR07_08150 [Mycobacteriales bacterium]|jgi:hypothetical protein|nr:hypothetical protein [Mycobacteriales bacterium]